MLENYPLTNLQWNVFSLKIYGNSLPVVKSLLTQQKDQSLYAYK